MWTLLGLCALAHGRVSSYVSGMRDNMCIEEKKDRVVLSRCNASHSGQLITTRDEPFTLLQFDSGRCLSKQAKMVYCQVADAFKISPYVWESKVYSQIRSSNLCLTNPKLVFEPCYPNPLQNRSQLFFEREIGNGTRKNALKDKDDDWAFDQTRVISFNMEFSTEQKRAQMEGDPLSEAYLPSLLTVDYGTDQATVFEGVGLRYKGSYGSFGLCIDPTSKSLNGVCRLLSLKVDTNKFIKGGQKIFGLKKLIFNGMPIDYSLMAERVAFKAFQTVGVIAPRAVHAAIYLNGNLSGVYAWVEAIDDSFTAKHFITDNNRGKGGLYKDAWLRGVQPGDYTMMWAKGKDEDDFLAYVAREIFQATDEDAVGLMETYFDTESIVNVIAMNAVLGMTDDWRWRHNFWWYVRDTSAPQGPSVKKLVMLPWDYDRTNDESWMDRVKQGPWWELWNPLDPRCTNNQTTSASANDTTTLWFWNLINLMLPPDFSRPIQCDKLTRFFSVALKQRVQTRTRQFAEIISMDRIKGWIDQWSAQIAPLVGQELAKPTVEDWKLAKAGLLFHYMTARAVAGFENVGALTGGLSSLGLSLETLIEHTGGDLSRLIKLGQPRKPTPQPSPMPYALLPPLAPPTPYFSAPSAPSSPAGVVRVRVGDASTSSFVVSPVSSTASSSSRASSAAASSSFPASFPASSFSSSSAAAAAFASSAPASASSASSMSAFGSATPYAPTSPTPAPVTQFRPSGLPLSSQSTGSTAQPNGLFAGPPLFPPALPTSTTPPLASPLAPPQATTTTRSTSLPASTSLSSPSFSSPSPLPPPQGTGQTLQSSFLAFLQNASLTPFSTTASSPPQSTQSTGTLTVVAPVVSQVVFIKPPPNLQISGPIIVPANTPVTSIGFQALGPLTYGRNVTTPFRVPQVPTISFPLTPTANTSSTNPFATPIPASYFPVSTG